MTWRVQSLNEGPLVLGDIGLTFRKNDIRDLDLIGREHAEGSNDIRIALDKGWLKELEKGPSPAGAGSGSVGVPQEVVDKLSAAAERAEKTANAQSELIDKLEGSNRRLEEQLRIQQEKMAQQDNKTDGVVEEVRAYLEKDPLGIKVLKETLENIAAERGVIANEKAELKSSGDSEAEISAKDKILNLRDKKLEKNAESIGKTIAGSADDIDDLLGDLDALGI